jgi:cyclophilin family peptidyl-prolyl cis-trans isomerase
MPDWAPVGAGRFAELVTAGYFIGVPFHRVIPGFVAQLGLPMSGDRATWVTKPIEDETPNPYSPKNLVGTVAFASKGPGQRTTQIFANLDDNDQLDGQGFTPFGKVVVGLELLQAMGRVSSSADDQIYKGAGQGGVDGVGSVSAPDPEQLLAGSATYLEEACAGISRIVSCTLELM